jgi:hypothetical protein
VVPRQPASLDVSTASHASPYASRALRVLRTADQLAQS